MVPPAVSSPAQAQLQQLPDTDYSPLSGSDRAPLQTVAIVGLGHVGLPIGLALHAAGFELIGIDASKRRLDDIRQKAVDLSPADLRRLELALDAYDFDLGSSPSDLERADAVLVCVPMIDAERRLDPSVLQAACRDVVAHARAGQLIVVTGTNYVDSTRELLIEPLRKRGLEAGRDVHVAFAPERIEVAELTKLYESSVRG